MPGHMNVLLAEANVPYPQLYEMDQINPDFPRTDVALVIGANDVTNPAARSDRSSPIFGMPILDVDKAQNVVVLKRSMNPGFAGVDNPLYTEPQTAMLFGDARESVVKLVQAVKDLERALRRGHRAVEVGGQDRSGAGLHMLTGVRVLSFRYGA
jgi:NAD(P) transhydrogenase subunit beta